MTKLKWILLGVIVACVIWICFIGLINWIYVEPEVYPGILPYILRQEQLDQLYEYIQKS
jgi:hypothetical protein